MERTGNYVFHGSSKLLNKLEPREGEDMGAEKMEKDRYVVVYGCLQADIAIFRSLINPEGVEGITHSRFGFRNGQY